MSFARHAIRARGTFSRRNVNPFVAWVIAKPNDPSLAPLVRIDDATIVVGDRAESFANAPAPDALLCVNGAAPLFEAVWERAGRPRWVHSRFAGVEHVLFPSLLASDAVVTNGRGAFAPALAEFTIGALLFFAKDFRRMLRSQAAGVWDPFQPDELGGQTLGIVGYGAIGRAVAGLAKPLGMRVVATRRRIAASSQDPLVDELVPAERTDDVFAKSDHVVVCAPLTSETRGLVGARAIGAMRAHGVLVNVGRGPVVDERALIAALESGAIRGAALDVFEVEPLPAGHPFYRSERVLLSPHCADRVPGWLERATEVFVENVERFRRGEPLVNVVDKTRGY
jgi:phosphoglycerate dehydrogenase-like enzyme